LPPLLDSRDFIRGRILDEKPVDGDHQRSFAKVYRKTTGRIASPDPVNEQTRSRRSKVRVEEEIRSGRTLCVRCTSDRAAREYYDEQCEKRTVLHRESRARSALMFDRDDCWIQMHTVLRPITQGQEWQKSCLKYVSYAERIKTLDLFHRIAARLEIFIIIICTTIKV